MAEQAEGMRPIWFFVGILLICIGGIILGSGILNIASPPKNPVVLENLHPDIWWGAIMVVFGIILFLFNKSVRIG